MYNKIHIVRFLLFFVFCLRENVWKPADIFSTLGERELDRSLLEAKKAQWRKELGK